jgi:hypothetical protein
MPLAEIAHSMPIIEARRPVRPANENGNTSQKHHTSADEDATVPASPQEGQRLATRRGRRQVSHVHLGVR